MHLPSTHNVPFLQPPSPGAHWHAPAVALQFGAKRFPEHESTESVHLQVGASAVGSQTSPPGLPAHDVPLTLFLSGHLQTPPSHTSFVGHGAGASPQVAWHVPLMHLRFPVHASTAAAHLQVPETHKGAVSAVATRHPSLVPHLQTESRQFGAAGFPLQEG